MTVYAPGPHAMRVVANLSALRLMRGWTYVELADELLASGHKLNPSTLWRLEAGRRWVTVDELFLFAEVFNVDPADLLFETFALTVLKAQP